MRYPNLLNKFSFLEKFEKLYLTNIACQSFFFLAPSAAPMNIQGKALSSTSLLISWDPPPLDHRNGPITNYTIKYRIKGDRARYNLQCLLLNRLYYVAGILLFLANFCAKVST